VAYKDDVKSPLLEAYSRYFAGRFWIRGASVRPEAMSTRMLGPGEGLYDALQLCRQNCVRRFLVMSSKNWSTHN
jgi:hypothetical protein